MNKEIMNYVKMADAARRRKVYPEFHHAYSQTSRSSIRNNVLCACLAIHKLLESLFRHALKCIFECQYTVVITDVIPILQLLVTCNSPPPQKKQWDMTWEITDIYRV